MLDTQWNKTSQLLAAGNQEEAEGLEGGGVVVEAKV